MQKENTMTVGQWCGQWFTANRHKWNGNTEGGYRNLFAATSSLTLETRHSPA